MLFISFVNDCVYLNGIKIIDKRAVRQIDIFKLFVSEQVNSIIENSRNMGLAWYDLATKLESISGNIVSEQYVRQLIYDIRNKAKKIDGGSDIIKMVDGRYFFGEKVALIMQSKSESL